MICRKKILYCCCFLLYFCCFSNNLSASPIISEARENRIIQEIVIQAAWVPEGGVFDSKPVLEKLKTKVGDSFSHALFDADLKFLSEQYDKIEPRVEISPSEEVVICIKVWPRPLIQRITWEGNVQLKTETLKKELGVKEGIAFNRVEFNKKFNKIREYYIKKGYFESQLSYSIQPIPNSHEVEVQIQILEGRSGIIDEIQFVGFTAQEKSKILGKIYTKQYRFLTSWLTGTGKLQEEAIEQDRLTILNFFHNRGYADAKLDIEVHDATTEGRIVVLLKLDRGPVFHYGEVTFQGNSIFSDQKIEGTFLIHPEEQYSLKKLHETVQALKNLYGRQGYIDASIQYETELVADCPIYNVHFEIEEGIQYKIGLIRIFGNEQTESHVILRESLLVPGDVFDSVKLKATQERLQNIGYFKNVNVYAVRTQEEGFIESNYRDIYIEVEEAPTGHASLFFGLSSGDGAFGGLDITESNFNYKGFGNLPKEGPSALRGGGEYAHAKVTVGSKQRTYLISWLTPYFRDSPWRVGFDGFLTQSQLQAKKYEIDSVGGSFFASYPLTSYWTVGTKYRFKHAKIDVSHNVSYQERQAQKGTGNISAASTSLNYDSTDHIAKPHRGLRSLLEIEFAGIGGDFAFLKYSYVNTFYQPLWKRGVMKYRWEARFIQPLMWTHTPQSIPLSERFFIGGENSVRGYKAFGLGPIYPNGDPKGGIGYSVLSLEYLQEIVSIVDGFLFIDAGSISLKKFHLPQYQMSYGVGLRIEVMNRVPITVGIGFPVNAVHRSQIQRFFFSMGGQF